MWENMKLMVVDYDKIPNPRKVLGFFPNCKMSISDICKLVQATNQCVSMNRWTSLSNKKSERGTHVAFAVSEDQFKILESVGFRLFFGAGRATFKDISKGKGDTDAQNEEETAEESDTDTVASSESEQNCTVVPNKVDPAFDTSIEIMETDNVDLDQHTPTIMANTQHISEPTSDMTNMSAQQNANLNLIENAKESAGAT